MARTFVIFVCVAVVLSVLGTAYLHEKPADSRLAAGVPLDWKYIREVGINEGGARAYEEFAREAADKSPSAQHVAAHIFGKALYDAEGVGAVAVCDDRFLYGCFHAVLMAALGDKGLGAIGELQKVCTTVRDDFRIQCEHGIGHGIVGVLGYEDNKIVQSMDLCDTQLPLSNPINGCKGGVFMENVLRLAHDGTTHPRAFDEAKKWGPCDILDANSHDGCAYWQPEWWTKTALREKPPEERAKIMGSWCDQVSYDTQFRAFCMYGITYLMPGLTGEIPEKSSEICKLLARNQDEQTTCQEGSAIRFIYYMPLEKSLRACNGLSPADASHCRDAATQFTKNRRRDQFMPSGGE